ncbi:MAG TPA: Imm50 family immunity protein [Verrucomicrobiae bacterium]|jgi:hypothetical protein|nr:Imm50 family immunity protein [Verrucomicrobiae bacterium]
MKSAPPYLRNTNAVLKAFGYWPSFHDAPVVAFRYDRKGHGAVELTLHGWEMTADVDARGFYKLIKRHLVRFAFKEITEPKLDEFDSENILFGLNFSSPEDFAAVGRFSVELDSAIGCELCGSFCAKSGEVLEVIPCDAEGRPE